MTKKESKDYRKHLETNEDLKDLMRELDDLIIRRRILKTFMPINKGEVKK